MQVLPHLLDANEWRWLGSLAVELRVLIHWQEDAFTPKNARKRKNIPLRFREAAYQYLALPVYIPALQRDANLGAVQICFDAFTMTHTSGRQRVADVQQWLANPAGFAPGVEPWLVRGLIAQFTETKGPGNYDTGVPSVINFLSRSWGFNASVAEQFIYRVGEGVIILCGYVLAHFDVVPKRST